MAAPTTREEFKDYILRKLGQPVIQVNVSDEQVEDRVDEAVSFWRDYHYNGSQLVYLKHELTADTLHCQMAFLAFKVFLDLIQTSQQVKVCLTYLTNSF